VNGLHGLGVKRIARVLFCGVLLATTCMALLPCPPAVPGTGNDKINRFAAFLVLSLLYDWAYPKLRFAAIKAPVLLAYGLAIELTQAFIPNRECSAVDLLADAVALVVYGIAASYVRRHCGSSNTEPQQTNH
jgi:VanZ family protein